ncbi:MAG: hypothetical protein ACRC2T_02410 [Thermoguttaceae bacterium]
MSRLVLLTVLLFALVFVSKPAKAQEAEEALRFLRSPMGTETTVGNYLAFSRARWNGNSAYMGAHAYLLNSEAKEELGLSDEQFARLDAICRGQIVFREKREQQDPVLINAINEVERTRLDDDPLFNNAEMAQIQAHSLARQKLTETNISLMQQEIEKVLTPEQMQLLHVRDLQLSTEVGLPTPSMYEALDLTDQQRTELAAIQKAMEPEFEALLDQDAAIARDIHQFMIDAITKRHEEKPFVSMEDIEKYLDENIGQLYENEPLKEKFKQMLSRGQDFTNRLKIKMLDVLTDDQLAKMQELLNHPSDFVKKELQEFRTEREEREKTGQWKPGSDSWKPGDGIPEEYLKERQERKSRFPKKK